VVCGSTRGTTIEDLLDDNPSLRPAVAERLPRAYQLARLLAVKETSLMEASFPQQCPYSATETLDLSFYPA